MHKEAKEGVRCSEVALGSLWVLLMLGFNCRWTSIQELCPEKGVIARGSDPSEVSGSPTQQLPRPPEVRLKEWGS